MADNFLNWIFGIDERFIMHRYKSTRAAVIAAAVLMAVWTWYEYFINEVVRWDLVIIMVVTAVVKVGTMLYYRITN